jgi:DNA-binding NtrC family response regulator
MAEAGQAREQDAPPGIASWIAADPASVALLEQARRVASASSTVLIRGESGTGKDLLASLLHYLGPSWEEPLVTIDCASLPFELMESELFGYEPGAFTGATGLKRGRLELAGGGTLVLNEIAALPLSMQAKLLRVIEEKQFERLGGHKPIKVRARIVACTHAELEAAVAQRTFRDDLYYRLSVVPLLIPALRDRRGDIAPLTQHFLKYFCELHQKPQLAFSAAAIKTLDAYSYPGNVRELRNLVERAVVQSRARELGLSELPAGIDPARDGECHKSLAEVERDHIAQILDATRGKKNDAAKILGISRKTLLEKRKRYKLD